jgi:hypothetical protein
VLAEVDRVVVLVVLEVDLAAVDKAVAVDSVAVLAARVVVLEVDSKGALDSAGEDSAGALSPPIPSLFMSSKTTLSISSLRMI